MPYLKQLLYKCEKGNKITSIWHKWGVKWSICARWIRGNFIAPKALIHQFHLGTNNQGHRSVVKTNSATFKVFWLTIRKTRLVDNVLRQNINPCHGVVAIVRTAPLQIILYLIAVCTVNAYLIEKFLIHMPRKVTQMWFRGVHQKLPYGL